MGDADSTVEVKMEAAESHWVAMATSMLQGLAVRRDDQEKGNICMSFYVRLSEMVFPGARLVAQMAWYNFWVVCCRKVRLNHSSATIGALSR